MFKDASNIFKRTHVLAYIMPNLGHFSLNVDIFCFSPERFYVYSTGWNIKITSPWTIIQEKTYSHVALCCVVMLLFCIFFSAE